jgi:hypothetical protein
MGKADKPRNGGGMVADSRFAAVHYDPRFQRFPKAKSQVEIDERFAGKWRHSCRQSCLQQQLDQREMLSREVGLLLLSWHGNITAVRCINVCRHLQR